MGEFKREERYIVIKRKQLTEMQEQALRAHIDLSKVPTVECVVVESDWPEYETVWGIIEAHVAGLPTPTAEKADVVEALPPLPKPAILYSDHGFTAFAGWQMEAYARAAIAALQSRSVETAGDICKLASAIPSNPLDIAAGIRDAALALADEPAGEQPKGWLYNGVWSATRLPEFIRGEMTETPLYARPATSNQDGLVGWRTIESAPKDGTEIYVWGVLECSPYSRPRIGCDDIHRAAFHGEGWLLCGPQVDGSTWVCGVEFWMPLPAAPALNGEKGE